MLITILVISCVIIVICMYYLIDKKPKSIIKKHIVITGGSSGIGKGVAIAAAKRGADVTIIARNTEKLCEAKKDIQATCSAKTNQIINIVSLDVTSYEDVQTVVQKIDEENPIYMLVNCAGMAICGKTEDISIHEADKLFKLNFFGTYNPLKMVLPLMKRRNEGIIVVTASQAALMGIFGLGIYSATKFALRGLTESLDMEVRPYNISVTLALPPDTDTPGFANENKNKPVETALISESGGLYKPEAVGESILNDALTGKFYSSIGLESFMLTTLCSGMAPFSSFVELIIQSFLIGPFRLVGSFYLMQFQQIVKKCKTNKED